jgi:hypothetical protein
VAGASFNFVDAFDGPEINRIDGEAVEGVGGKGDDLATAEASDNVVDERGLGLVGMDTEGFGRQCGLLLVGCHPLIIVQSLLPMRLRSGLRRTIGVNQRQSLPGKEDDSSWRRTFFTPGFILVEETVESRMRRRLRIRVRFSDGSGCDFQQSELAGETAAGGVSGSRAAERRDDCD